MGSDRRKLLCGVTTWSGMILLAAAIVYFVLVMWPAWQPKLVEFWQSSRGAASLPSIILAFIALILGYYFAPDPWRKILDALKVPRIDKGEVRRNWYVTQMGQYVPGKFWLVIGRVTFLRANGTSPVKAVTGFVLENIYMMMALALMTVFAIPFLTMTDVPIAVIIALAVSVGFGIMMLFAPSIQRRFAKGFSRRFGQNVDDLPHISHRHQFVFIGYHLLSWTLRSLALYLWFRGFGVQPARPFAMVAVCFLAAPVSWLISFVMVFIPGGIGIREGVQGLLLASFVPGGVQVATIIALGHRVMLMLVEGFYALQAIVYGTLRKRFTARMNHIEQIFHLAGSVFKGALALHGLSTPPQPINVTFSVTRRCQSRCRTCFIWNHEQGEDMDLPTIERLFRSIGWTYFFNVSGGEPYLRDDLPEIVKLACRFMKPAVVHIPTNALAPERIERITREILRVIEEEAPGTVLTVKPSFDGVGSLHDEIRGVPGNFEKLEDTLRRLIAIRGGHSNLHVGVGTVVSRFNADRLDEIIEYSKNLGVDTYINEVAEEREEFFNLGSGITPDGDSYGRIMDIFKRSVRERMKGMKLLARMTTALRIVYYDLAVRILKERSQVIPCSAGLLNVHINSDGGIWPCAVLGYRGEIGKLGPETDFMEIWRSSRARKIRRSIRRGECACPLANQAYSNILLNPRALLRTLWIALRGSRGRT
jgi:MoaA/NifB/PqqE/SkfB family radical SAM enzyme